jgi:hypothetical protein
MINELLNNTLTGRNGNKPQAVDIVDGKFSPPPGTKADAPRTPGNTENPPPWVPDQWLGYGKVD